MRENYDKKIPKKTERSQMDISKLHQFTLVVYASLDAERPPLFPCSLMSVKW